MKANFDRCLALVLKHEGGFVNHPKDPGGATNKGITQAVYDQWRRSRGQETRSVRGISAAEVRDIYKKEYWDRSQCDHLASGVDYAVFDFSVNSGVSRSVRMLQKVSGAAVDGVAGMQTIAKANAMDPVQLITEICTRRHNWMRGLKTYAYFGRGWRRRVMGNDDGYQKTDFGVIDYAINMALEEANQAVVKTVDMPAPAPIGAKDGEEAPAKALDQDQSIIKSKIGAGSILAGASAVAPVALQASEAVKPHMGTDSIVSTAAMAIFALLVLIGIGLTLYSYKQKIDERKSA